MPRAASASTAKPRKVRVTEDALVQRLRHRLAKEERSLRRARAGRADEALGPYYVVGSAGPYANGVLEQGLNLAALVRRARELGVLRDWEEVAS